MDKPLIALTLQHDLSADRLWLQKEYAEAIRLCGGIPIVLPPSSLSDLSSLIKRTDGVLLTGGPDLNPAYYGEETSPLCGAISDCRDAFEISLVRLCFQHDRPLFGICRGIQVMNAALGGTLVQHTPLHSGDYPEGRRLHPIRVSEFTYCVNSRHHQLIDRTAPPFRVFARDENGDIEGICLPGKRFFIGVQWHPEQILHTEPLSRALFVRFIEECRKRLPDRGSGSPSDRAWPQAPFSS